MANPGPEYECNLHDPPLKFSTLGESVLHQKCHTSDKNFSFHCQWMSCGLKFLTYTALDLHVRYSHHQFRHIPQLSSTPLDCTYPSCHEVFASSKLLCQHLMKKHQIEDGNKVQCPFKDMCKSENSFPLASFKTHLSQKHKGWTTGFKMLSSDNAGAGIPDAVDPNANEEVNMDVEDGYEFADDNMDIDVDPEGASEAAFEEDKLPKLYEQFYHSFAMFFLKLESVHLIPADTVQKISESIAQLSELALLTTREVLSRELDGLVEEHVKEQVMMNTLSADPLYATLHKDAMGPNLSTKCLRKNYYKSHFKYVKAKEINLSKDPVDPKNIYYVPIQHSLNLALSKPEIAKEVQASFSHHSEPGVIKDYKDGSVYKLRKENSNEKTLDLLIFQDAFTPTKDLSSVSNVYQILGVYMTIGNLRPHLRSKLSCIQLVMLMPDFKTIFTDFKVTCFQRLVDDLKLLETNGITFQGEQIRVQLQFLIGDNKGQHEIGGFIQSFSSEFFCRYCPMPRTAIQEEPWRVGPLRSAASYEEASRSVKPGLKTHVGVSRPEWLCPFNSLKDFHVCDPSLAPCIGHDVFEGVINYDLGLIIHNLVKQKWFTLQEINRKIKKFKYIGHDSGNKPAPVKDPKNTDEPILGGHAVQNWTLLRLLVFIIEDRIKDVNDKHWKLYLSLKELVEYACAPSITLEQLSCLKVLVENYAVQRKEVLGNGKPKHHFLSHYPDLTEMMGPLIHVMTLRFESFHQFFKQYVRKSHNFINVGKSCVKKYCMYLAYLYAGSVYVEGVKVLEEGVTVATKMAIEYSESCATLIAANDISNNAIFMTKIMVDEIVFKEGEWLLLGNADDISIVVGRITAAVLDGSQVYILLSKYVASRLSCHGIYRVDEDKTSQDCIKVQELKYPTPLSMYAWDDHDLCFSLKHTLSNVI